MQYFHFVIYIIMYGKTIFILKIAWNEWMRSWFAKKKMHIIEYAVCEKWPVSSWIEHATGFVVWHHAIHFKTYIHIHLENYHSINNKRQLMVFLYTYADLTTFEWLPHSLAQLWRICLLASSNNYISRDFFLFSFNSSWIVYILFIVRAHSVFLPNAAHCGKNSNCKDIVANKEARTKWIIRNETGQKDSTMIYLIRFYSSYL